MFHRENSNFFFFLENSATRDDTKYDNWIYATRTSISEYIHLSSNSVHQIDQAETKAPDWWNKLISLQFASAFPPLAERNRNSFSIDRTRRSKGFSCSQFLILEKRLTR